MKAHTVYLVASTCLAVSTFASAPRPADPTTITVTEGTSMAIAVSPDGSRIALDLQGGLWMMAASGGTAERITDEYGDVRQPSWSPDGRTVAFQSYRDGQWRIWTVAADGTDLRAVTNGPFDDREPAWSPDGSAIAFSSDRSGNYDVWTLDLATGSLQQVTTNADNDFFPAWSPDGSRLAFVSTRAETPGVYTIGADGSAEDLAVATAGSVGAPSWSPAGQLLFSVVPGTQAMAAGEQPQLLLDGTPIAEGEDYHPFRAHWLSTDEFLYPADGKVKRRSLASGTATAIEFTATLSVVRPTYTRKVRSYEATTQRALGIVRPTMAPDGERVALAALADLWVVPTGGTPVQLTDDSFVDSDPAWSPDGQQLAFTSDRAGSMDIWIRDLEAGTDRRLTTMPDAEMAPAWSADGRQIAFVSNVSYEQAEVFVVPAEGGEPRRVLERTFGVGYPSWSADGRFLIVAGLKPYSTRYREGMNYYLRVPVEAGTPEMIVPQAHMPVGKRAGDGPALAPDGRHLAYVSNALLYVVPVDPEGRVAGTPRQLTTELADSISWAGPEHILYIATDQVRTVSIVDGSTTEIPIDVEWTRHVPAGRVVVHADRLIDGASDGIREGVDVVIDGNRITSIEPHRDGLHEGTVVDARGRTVMPGLIESHGHQLKEHGDLFGRVHLAYGITSFRNVGAVPYEAVEEKEAIEAGRRVGPRVFTTGYLLDGSRPYYPMASPAPTAAIVDMEVERARRLDYDMLKTYVRLPDLLQRRAIEGAHRIGIPVSSHEIYPSALSGVDSVEHTGATSRRGYSTKQSLLGRAYDDVIQIVSASGMTITPTLGLGGFTRAAAGDPTLLADPRMQLLQPHWTTAAIEARAQRAGGPGPQAAPASWRTVLALHRAGATIVAGVDSPLTPFASALHVELQDYVAAGLTPIEAIRTATVNPAVVMGAGADLGTLEPGKLADLVVVDGNPLIDITDTRRVVTVIKNGVVYRVEELIGERPGAAPE